MGSQMNPKNLSLEDIDELTYMLTLGLREDIESPSEMTISRGSSWFSHKLSVETDKLLQPSEVPHEKVQTQSVDTLEEFEEEQQVSEVSISDKMLCLKYTDIENIAEMFVDEIIDVSVEVCEKLFEAAICGEDDDIVTDKPCICESSTKLDSEGPAEKKSDSSTAEFSGWPTIRDFTIRGAKKKIMEYMRQWHFVEDWKYTVYYIASYSDTVSDYNLFQAMWSIPTKEYPIPQATATIFFTIEVPRVKPKFCLVDVTIQFEGSRSVYKAGQFEFMEQWLFNIIDSKLNLFKTLRF